MVFHAGTAFDGTTLKTSGGRVLAATAIAESLEVAVQKAYAGVQCVHFDKMHYRTDIAHRLVANPKNAERGS
jgi:phosphoribosylamine--glycine ligase/phosphoribosylformylglycinamidine cyclo-ligase